MTTKSRHIQVISKRLLAALGILLGVVLLLLVVSIVYERAAIISLLTILVGAIGGFVGLQRRLKQLSNEDIEAYQSWAHALVQDIQGEWSPESIRITFQERETT